MPMDFGAEDACQCPFTQCVLLCEAWIDLHRIHSFFLNNVSGKNSFPEKEMDLE